MNLYISYDYKNIYPNLKGRDLTEEIISVCINHYRRYISSRDGEKAFKRISSSDKVYNEHITVERSDKGKPYISGGSFISVSHSENTIAIAVSEFEVGIDIQHERTIDMRKISNRFFTPDEYRVIAAICEDKDLAKASKHFFNLWTEKESYAKFTGEGMAYVLGKDKDVSKENVRFLAVDIVKDCFCTICTEKNSTETKKTISVIKIEDIQW